MLKDITLGQFFPGRSVLHRSDPRMKIILTMLYIIVVFLSESTVAYLVTVAFTLGLAIISRINVRVILKGLKPLLFIMIFTAFFNIFWTKGESEPLLQYGVIKIYKEAMPNNIAPLV